MNRLFLTDLDHTFLNSNQEISPFSRDIWNRKSQEEYLSVATARSLFKVNEFFRGLNLNSPLILLDGAVTITRDMRDSRFKPFRFRYRERDYRGRKALNIRDL